jgi:hypothetical protein
LGINLVSTKVVNEYELRLQIGLASYQVGFSVIGSDPLRYAGVRLTGHWATVAGCWADWRVAGRTEPVGRLDFGPLG